MPWDVLGGRLAARVYSQKEIYFPTSNPQFLGAGKYIVQCFHLLVAISWFANGDFLANPSDSEEDSQFFSYPSDCNQQVVLGDSCELLTGQITTQLVKVSHCYVATIEGTAQLLSGDWKPAHAQLVTHVEVSFTWGGGQLVVSWKFMLRTLYSQSPNSGTQHCWCLNRDCGWTWSDGEEHCPTGLWSCPFRRVCHLTVGTVSKLTCHMEKRR